eukprot:3142094-Ditylum_brightwellii.AAC.1
MNSEITKNVNTNEDINDSNAKGHGAGNHNIANFKAHLGNSDREPAKGANRLLKTALNLKSIEQSSAINAAGK